MARASKRASYKRKPSSKRNSLTREEAVVGGIGYGMLREKVSDIVKNFSGGFGVNLADELLLGGLGYYVAGKTKGIVQNIAITATAVESHNFMRSGMQGVSPAPAQSTNGVVVIG